MRERGTTIALSLLLSCGGDDGAGAATDAGSTGGTGTSTTSTSASGPATTGTTAASSTDGGSTSGDSSAATTAGSGGSTTDGVPPEGSFYVYVTSNDNEVSAWSMDPADGALTLLQTETTTGGGIGPLAVRPDLAVLYAITGGSQEVTAFAIDPESGTLAALGSTDLGLDGVYVSVHPAGTHLLSATFGGDEIAVFPIGATGVVQTEATSRISTSAEPHFIAADPSGQWVFVPHRTPGVIGQYAFDGGSGMLTPNAEPTVDAPAGAGPRHLAFHPQADYVYVANEFSDSVSVYAFDTSTGRLTLGATMPTIPEGFDGNDNTCADVHITPDGRSLYVSNRGHDSLAMFSVSGDGSTLTPLGQVATPPRPREFEVSPRGRYVFAAGQDSGTMAGYAVQPDGTLDAGPIYTVGDNPLWVLAIELAAR